MSGNTLVDSILEILQNVGPVVVDVSVKISVILVVITDVIDVQFILEHDIISAMSPNMKKTLSYRLTLHPMFLQ